MHTDMPILGGGAEKGQGYGGDDSEPLQTGTKDTEVNLKSLGPNPAG